MNIVFINPEYPSQSGRGHGGIATYVYIMANALCNAGHHVNVLVREGTIVDNQNKKISYYEFNNSPVSSSLSFLSRRLNGTIHWEKGCSNAALELVLKLHGERHIDIVEVPEYGGLASQFCQPLPFSVVIDFHTPTVLIDSLNRTQRSYEKSKWYSYEKKAIKNGTAYKCPSLSLTKKVKTLYSIPSEQVTIIRNPIKPDDYKSINKKHIVKNNSNRFTILFSGRLERRKGAEIILRAIMGILDIHQSITIVFAGETNVDKSTNYRHKIECAVNAANRKRISFLGPLDREKLTMHIAQSDLFLAPSLFENAPYTILEAMVSKLPVLGADTDGINEIIKHRETGMLFSLTELDSLYSCLRELVHDEKLRNLLASNAYKYVCTHHNPIKIARETIEFYDTIRV